MRRRILVAATTLALTVMFLPSVAAQTTVSAPGTRLPTLAGTTVLSGHRSASMRVRMPRPGIIDLTARSDAGGNSAPAALTTSGGRGHVGFLLTTPGSTEGLSILAARLPQMLQDRGDGIAGVGHGQTRPDPRKGAAACVRCRVPAGVYDLHLLTRGDATVTITIEGLGGRRRLQPGSRTNTYAFHAPLSSHDYDNGEFTAGIESSGWGLGMQWYDRSDGLLLSTYEMTLLAGETPAPAGTIEVCSSARRNRRCVERFLAGANSSVAGSGVVAARDNKTVKTMLEWTFYGFAEYRSRLSLLWIDVPEAPAARSGPIIEAASGGVVRTLYDVRR